MILPHAFLVRLYAFFQPYHYDKYMYGLHKGPKFFVWFSKAIAYRTLRVILIFRLNFAQTMAQLLYI